MDTLDKRDVKDQAKALLAQLSDYCREHNIQFVGSLIWFYEENDETISMEGMETIHGTYGYLTPAMKAFINVDQITDRTEQLNAVEMLNTFQALTRIRNSNNAAQTN